MANSPSPDPLEAGQYQPAPAPPPTFKLPQEFRQAAVKVDNIDSGGREELLEFLKSITKQTT